MYPYNPETGEYSPEVRYEMRARFSVPLASVESLNKLVPEPLPESPVNRQVTGVVGLSQRANEQLTHDDYLKGLEDAAQNL